MVAAATLVKPKLRGVFHEIGFYVALAVGALSVAAAEPGRARAAAAIFAGSVAVCFGTSALYHRPTWTPGVRAWLARLDHAGIYPACRRYVEARREEELGYIIADEGLDPDATRAFVERAFRDGAIPTTGAAVTQILPPISRFGTDDGYGIRKQAVLDRLTAFFDRYFALG
jgi:hypothetical protein